MNNIGGCMPRVNDTYIHWIEVQSKDVQGWHYYTTFSYIMSKRLMLNTKHTLNHLWKTFIFFIFIPIIGHQSLCMKKRRRRDSSKGQPCSCTFQCSTMQHNIAQYSTLQKCSVLPRSVQFITEQYSTVQYSTIHFSRVQYSSVQHNSLQQSRVQQSTVQYNTVQYSTVQCSAVQQCTIQYDTGLNFTQYNIFERCLPLLLDTFN